MSAIELERQLRSFLAEGPLDPPAAVVESALVEARTLRQVRTLELPWSHLPRLVLPEAQALGRFGLATAVLALAVLIGIWGFSGVSIPPAESPSPTASSGPTPSASPLPTTPPPTPDISATPAPDLTPAPQGFAVPQGLSWQQLSDVEGIPTDALLNDLLSTESGYVAVGRLADDINAWSSWFSSDGNSWARTPLARPPGCSGDATFATAASSPGRGVLVMSSSGCQEASAVAHYSPDGSAWSTGVPFGSGATVAVWSAPGGWEAQLGSFDDGSELWSSADGLNWARTTMLTEPGRFARRGAASADGTRLVAVSERFGQTELLRSDDALSWEVVPGAFGEVLEIEPPAGSTGWLVVADPDLSDDGVDLWSSHDLNEWTLRMSLQRNLGFSNLASTRYGSLVSGVEGCWPTGEEPQPCAPGPEAYTQYLSGDGVEWLPFTTALSTAKRSHFVADGPSGVVALQLTDAGELAIWRLTRDPGPRWEELGGIESEDDDFRLIGFGAGYVAWQSLGTRAWFSENGSQWQPADLPENDLSCEGEVQADQIEAAASSGSRVMLLGSSLVPSEVDEFCWLRSVVWFTDDGLNWERSAFGEPRALSEASPQAIWSVQGDFEAAVAAYRTPSGDGSFTMIWRSSDGFEWTPIAALDGFGDVVGAASIDGSRVVSVSSSTLSAEGAQYFQHNLATSADGSEWTTLEAPLAGRAVREVLAPAGAGGQWTLLLVDGSGEEPALLTSTDLIDWNERQGPAAETSALALTPVGLFATGCEMAGVECSLYLAPALSGEWQGFPPEAGSMSVADGPAGVLAIRTWPPSNDRNGVVFRLEP